MIGQKSPYVSKIFSISTHAYQPTHELKVHILVTLCTNLNYIIIFLQLIWKDNSPIITSNSVSRTMSYISNPAITGPSRPVWFLETAFFVFVSYVLAYYIPQVSHGGYWDSCVLIKKALHFCYKPTSS